MWYPLQARTKELESLLKGYETQILEHPSVHNDKVKLFSDIISASASSENTPTYAIRNWIWVASQYRLYAEQDLQIAKIAGRALLFLGGCLAKEQDRPDTCPPLETLERELGWVLDNTVCELTKIQGVQTFQTFLSQEERYEVDRRIEQLQTQCDFSDEKLTSQLHCQAAQLKRITSRQHLADMSDKISFLVAEAKRDTPSARKALAALAYLAENTDAVPDDLGILGLVDDIHAIEKTYSDITGNSSWLPVLQAFIGQWPIVEDLVIESSAGRIKPGKHLQFVLGASLQRTLLDKVPSVIIVPEVGPLAILTAFICSIAAEAGKSEHADQFDRIEEGCPVVFGHGGATIRANYAGQMAYSGNKFHRLELRHKNNTVKRTIASEIAVALEEVRHPHDSLSTSDEFDEWTKNYSPSPLSIVPGLIEGGPRSARNILLLGKKQTLDVFEPLLSPMGSSIPEWVGLRYYTSSGNEKNWKGSTSDTPAIWAASDPSVAVDILTDDREGDRPETVVCDCADTARRFDDLLSQEHLPVRPTILVFSSYAEREDYWALHDAGYQLWAIPYNDLEAPIKKPLTVFSDDLAARFVERQFNHTEPEAQIDLISHPGLEELVSHQAQIRGLFEDAERDEILFALFELTQFLRHVVSYPIGILQEDLPTLDDRLARVRNIAAVSRNYFSQANDLFELLSNVTAEEIASKNKSGWLKKTLGDAAVERTAVMCASTTIAANYQRATMDDPLLKRVSWTTFSELKISEPFELVVIPGWLRKKELRQFRDCNLSPRQVWGLYTFEKNWLAEVDVGSRRARTRLEIGKLAIHKTLTARYPSVPPKNEVIHVVSPDPEREIDDSRDEDLQLEFVRKKIDEAIKRNVSHPEAEERNASARLVIFDDVASYIWLRPQARVVNLSNVVKNATGRSSVQDLSANEAERLIVQPLSKVHLGDVLAFCSSENRDLVDMLADGFIENAEQKRVLSRLWKTALNEFSTKENAGVNDLTKLLAEAGVSRKVTTVRQWLDPDCPTLAPKSYASDIAAIANLTQNEALNRELKQVLDAIDEIYQAQRVAAHKLVLHVFRNGRQIEPGLISLKVNQTEINYETHKVRSIGDEAAIAVSKIGRIKSLGPASVANV